MAGVARGFSGQRLSAGKGTVKGRAKEEQEVWAGEVLRLEHMVP